MLAVRGVVSTLEELFQFLWSRKLWWLIPMVVVLLIFAVLIILGSISAVSPFIYSLF